MDASFRWFCHGAIPRLAAVLLLALVCSSMILCGCGGRIHEAARSGDLEAVKTLLKRNPDLVFSRDADGLTALHCAAGRGHKEVVELLLADKAEVDARDNNGNTPLHEAAAAGHKDVAELLVVHKAEVGAGGRR